MALKVPNEGELQLLKWALGEETPYNLYLRLYTDDETPADGDTCAKYTEFTSTVGYAAKTLTKTSWNYTQPSGVATATYAEQVFTFTGNSALNIYGYYVTNAAKTKLFWVERAASAWSPDANGDHYDVTPLFTKKTES